MRNNIAILAITVTVALLSGCEVAPNNASEDANAVAQTGPACSIESMAQLPDVRIASTTEETEPVPHCKVAGVIGTEINFELLLPTDWNGKFVMGVVVVVSWVRS